MKLWEKDKKTEQSVMNFTVGDDPSYDKLLAPYDIIASMAHAIMLGETGLLSSAEVRDLLNELILYFPDTCKDSFQLNPEDEDIHSHLENRLISKLGDTGKKIHTARSRNDQVAVALQLFIKEELRLIIKDTESLFNVLTDTAEKNSNVLIPGYTHTQVAMPSSIGLWLGAYAEALISDLKLLKGIINVVDQNALGTAAGYGSSFPIDRELTTKLAGFGDMLVSSVSAQLMRGKLESIVAFGFGAIASTLSRLSADMIMFMGQDMNFISFPDELTTGSSIMPHKKNPDVLELIRAHSNMLIQMPSMLNSITNNLTSGYHRDFQLTKEILFPGIKKLKESMLMTKLMVENMKVREGILNEDKYKYIFSVEVVNRKVMEGKSFRDAYMEVSNEIESGNYKPVSGSPYTHIGSIGNPGINRIKEKMKEVLTTVQLQPITELFKELKSAASKI